LAGLNGLKGFELQNIMISLTAADDGTNMNGSVSIPNPSVITVSMVPPPPLPSLSHPYILANRVVMVKGNVTLDVSVNGTQIGQSYLNDLTLQPGSNIIPLRSTINQTEVISLISGTKAAYPSGVIPLSIVGNSSVYNGVEIPYFTEALAANPLSTDMNVTQVLINSGLGELAGIL
jgi:hypothetical protein